MNVYYSKLELEITINLIGYAVALLSLMEVKYFTAGPYIMGGGGGGGGATAPARKTNFFLT